MGISAEQVSSLQIVAQLGICSKFWLFMIMSVLMLLAPLVIILFFSVLTFIPYVRNGVWASVLYSVSSVQSLDWLGRRWDMRDDSTEILFLSFLR